ncbi:MAG TPA: nickel ABC transporter permease [Patescibacteria group bacterium]|nr:nickel ABC transporter permease [Patescibacteria group bacterium]
MNRLKRKLLETVAFLFLLTVISFFLIKLAPGDPVRNILGAEDLVVTQAQIDELRKEMGLDQPLYLQYAHWFGKLTQLDLGKSITTHRDVVTEIVRVVPATLTLALSSLLVMSVIAFPLGILSALYRGSLVDKFANVFSLFGTSIPGFWLGLILIDLFAVRLGWLPTMGIGKISHLVLPSLTLGISMAPPYIRLLRASLIESMQKDYIRAARARGIGPVHIFFFHILRDSLLPVLTLFGVSLGSLLGGTVITEVLFGYPGLGSLAVTALLKKDYAVVQGFLLFMGIIAFAVNSLMDQFYRLANPAISIKEVEQR